MTSLAMLVALLFAGAAWPVAGGEPLVLLVQPPAWREEATRFDPRPLAQVLSRILGEEVRLEVSDDALGHWRAVAAGGNHALVFDEAHFTDYRIRRFGYTALVRDVSDVRFQVLVRPRTLITGPSDLAGRTVAVPAPPSLGAVRLMALFPRVTRAPRLVVMDARVEALEALARGDVAAALVPVDGDSAAPGAALVTDLSPGRALSVSPAIAEAGRLALVRALTGLTPSPGVGRALSALGVRALEPTSNEVYEEAERLLRGTWGYR